MVTGLDEAAPSAREVHDAVPLAQLNSGVGDDKSVKPGFGVYDLRKQGA